jgi:DnaK suppressor protein
MRRQPANVNQMLRTGRGRLENQVQGRMRDARAGRPAAMTQARDEIDQSEAGLQGDIELTLLQMKTENLARMNAALVRLDVGKYGYCADCDGDIGAPRLRAQPFAVRCQPCEERREQEQAGLGRAARQGIF